MSPALRAPEYAVWLSWKQYMVPPIPSLRRAFFARRLICGDRQGLILQAMDNEGDSGPPRAADAEPR
jgi:hypothetical protein